jgi:hypothetical protein
VLHEGDVAEAHARRVERKEEVAPRVPEAAFGVEVGPFDLAQLAQGKRLAFGRALLDRETEKRVVLPRVAVAYGAVERSARTMERFFAVVVRALPRSSMQYASKSRSRPGVISSNGSVRPLVASRSLRSTMR